MPYEHKTSKGTYILHTRAVELKGGRKQVIYFSEGFDGSLLTGSAGTTSLISGSSGGEGGRDVSSDPNLASSDDSFGSTRTVNDVEKDRKSVV